MRGVDDFIPPGKTLPHSIEAERAVLGSLLMFEDTFDRVSFLKEDHFVLAEHKAIFREYMALVDAGRLADPITLRCRLDQYGILTREYDEALGSIADSAVKSINAGEYARFLDELLVRRRLIEAGDEAISGAYNSDLDGATADVADRLENAVSGLLSGQDAAPRLWQWRDPATIPPRAWLIGRIMLRGEVSGIGGHGGRGKTTIAIALALSMASGKNIIGHRPVSRLRVLYLHMEEPDDEMDRRVTACMLHHGLTPNDIADRLYVRTGAVPVVDVGDDGMPRPRRFAIRAMVRRIKPDVIVVDPFRMSFQGEENSNDTLNEVVRAWKRIAGEANCAVLLVHHFRKGAVEAGDADAFRGGGAFIDACRAAYTVTRCTDEDAAGFGIPAEAARDYVMLADGKANMSQAGDETWYRLVSVAIGNANDLYPNGDNVQSVEQWTPPDVFDGLSTDQARAILEEIDEGKEGERFSKARRGTRWAGLIVDRHLSCGETVAKRMLATWVGTGVLYEDTYENKRGKEAMGLFLDRSKVPG